MTPSYPGHPQTAGRGGVTAPRLWPLRRTARESGGESLMRRNCGADNLSNYFRMRNVSDSLSQRQYNRNSSYLDLLDLVTSELNLKDLKVDGAEDNFKDDFIKNNPPLDLEIVESAFDFLSTIEDDEVYLESLKCVDSFL